MSQDASGLKRGPDDKVRCWWGANHVDYMHYHDTEWGHPVTDDRRLFEKIVLEGFQSGLSWLTILRKRENFRAAFAEFDFEKIARFGEKEVALLLQDSGIVRHRKKIESAINNAQKAILLQKEYGSLARYFWSFEPAPSERPTRFDYETLRQMATSPTSILLSKDLKKRGWSFVGPTTAYAFMQAMGLVNDHLEGCLCRAPIEKKRRTFKRP
ncbi:MAG: DNA-3-methyladenine glycosylase I [Saprospiraceae bacterium]|nr:DNA-3-methyladenine glycosylase I [Saprospiraceae bacterium]